MKPSPPTERKMDMSDVELIVGNIARRIEQRYGTTVCYDAADIIREEILKALEAHRKAEAMGGWRPDLPKWITPEDVDNAIRAFGHYDTKKFSLHNWRTMLECMKACRPVLPAAPKGVG